MIYLAIDHQDPKSGRPMPNGIPQSQHHLIERQDGRRLDYPRILYYLKQVGVNTTVVLPSEAPLGAWYPMVIGWFDFACDYLGLVSESAMTRIKRKEMLLIFTYHEGDHPGRIRKRLDELCIQHGVDPSVTWLISGNSTADQYDQSVYWPELEFMYWRSIDRTNYAAFHTRPRSRNYTALCRIDKLWRKVFMSELWQQDLHTRGYFSYNQVDLGSEDDYYGCALSNSYLASMQRQVDRFIAAGPFRVDNLDSNAHNTYSVNMTDLYADSYVNIVLETMIDIDDSGGVFVTEKTFKPIFNNQMFVIVSAANTLQHLKDLGYQTFGSLIDESYDAIENNQQRFEAVLELTCKLAKMPAAELHSIYVSARPILEHNHQTFVSGMGQRLRLIVNRISADYTNSIQHLKSVSI